MLKYVSEFTVTGCGDFPLDMLRYDRCSPFSSQDANSVGLNTMAACSETALKTLTEPRTVRLIRFTEGKGKNFNDNPTARRWESFGWKVTSVEFRKL